MFYQSNATPTPMEKERSLAALEEENPFVLPASTAPALLQTISRPKKARGQTIDYKAIHEGKLNRPKRSKENF